MPGASSDSQASVVERRCAGKVASALKLQLQPLTCHLLSLLMLQFSLQPLMCHLLQLLKLQFGNTKLL